MREKEKHDLKISMPRKKKRVMKNIKHCQVPLEEETIELLKKATGQEKIKNALTIAVNNCIKRYKNRLKRKQEIEKR